MRMMTKILVVLYIIILPFIENGTDWVALEVLIGVVAITFLWKDFNNLGR